MGGENLRGGKKNPTSALTTGEITVTAQRMAERSQRWQSTGDVVVDGGGGGGGGCEGGDRKTPTAWPCWQLSFKGPAGR